MTCCGSIYETAQGWGSVIASDQGLREVDLPFGSPDRKTAEQRMKSRHPDLNGENSLTMHAAILLAAYFRGEEVTFDLPLDLLSSPFRALVYAVVREIPRGQVRTYAEVADAIGKPNSARAVGGAMGNNPVPVIIPCHRVMGASGRLTGYSAAGGIAVKKLLLTMEGYTGLMQK